MLIKCGTGENISHGDIVSLDPTVIALGEHALGFRKHVNTYVEAYYNTDLWVLLNVKCSLMRV